MSLSQKNCKVLEAKYLVVGDSILTKDGYKKIVSISSAGVGDCCDIMLFKQEGLFVNEPNFLLSNGIVSHNCNLPIISDCIKLIQKTTGLHIARSDIPISDRESILMGSKRDLVGIFQFENPVTKPIADAVGMESLEDVAAITSLIRPGPMDAMIGDKRAPMAFAARKHGELYEAPEFLKEALKKTYGVMVYQEDCCSGSVFVWTNKGSITIEDLVRRVSDGEEIEAKNLSDDGDIVYRRVVCPRYVGEREVVEITLDNGLSIKCTPEHKLLTQRGWVEAELLEPTDDIMTIDELGL